MIEFTNKKKFIDNKEVLKTLQDKFGKKTPLGVLMNSDGSLRKIIIDKELSSSDKKWVTDKFPELA